MVSFICKFTNDKGEEFAMLYDTLRYTFIKVEYLKYVKEYGEVVLS